MSNALDRIEDLHIQLAMEQRQRHEKERLELLDAVKRHNVAVSSMRTYPALSACPICYTPCRAQKPKMHSGSRVVPTEELTPEEQTPVIELQHYCRVCEHVW